MDVLFLGIAILGGAFFLFSMIVGEAFGGSTDGVEHSVSHVIGNHFTGHAGTDHTQGVHDQGDGDNLHVNPFTPRSIALFAFMFGALGFISHSLLQLPLWIGFLTGTVAGGVSVWSLLQLTLFMLRQSGSTHATESDFTGILAKVIITIPPQGFGQVALEVRGSRENWSAFSDDGKAIQDGQLVVVLRKEGSHLVVSSYPEDL